MTYFVFWSAQKRVAGTCVKLKGPVESGGKSAPQKQTWSSAWVRGRRSRVGKTLGSGPRDCWVAGSNPGSGRNLLPPPSSLVSRWWTSYIRVLQALRTSECYRHFVNPCATGTLYIRVLQALCTSVCYRHFVHPCATGTWYRNKIRERD